MFPLRSVKARAHWVAKDTILWNHGPDDGVRFSLVYGDPVDHESDRAPNWQKKELALIFSRNQGREDIRARFPHLSGLHAFTLKKVDLEKIPKVIKGPVWICAWDQQSQLLDGSGLQIPGLLDDLYSYSGPLGLEINAGVPTLRLWAPTACSVRLHLFQSSRQTKAMGILPMTTDSRTGVWSITGTKQWMNCFYLYEVEVYVPRLKQVVHNLVTDPYSISLSMNSTRSQIVDINSAALKPGGWDTLEKPALEAPEDIVIYELHMRDFSALDTSLPPHVRGTYRAFTYLESNGMRHLESLAKAGLTHVHLLPVFDFTSVNENKVVWKQPDPEEMAHYAPNSTKQQELIQFFRAKDGYNWGYDPYHFSVPEGSYSMNPDGSERILEFRQMVQALNSIGLRVIMDVVYNHTLASGQKSTSVLDKIVPGYYYRLNADGEVETSTCCPNTATEHVMMEKLMIDSLVHWATVYKVDGFRFDLMGHHMRSNIERSRAALDALDPGRDGVDGRKIFLYGEGWNFGEVANNTRGVNASQANMGGSGIGVFNDRLRDAVRGGEPFSGYRRQGFATGLFDAPNGIDQGSMEDQRRGLLWMTDLIRLSLAGNLRDYQFLDASGRLARGDEIDFNGNPAGYTLDPQENVIYVAAHDNETLFDAIQIKASPEVPLIERIRMQQVALSLVMLGQGVPFFQAGDELLRSKSLDRNSFDSGDWFNHLDFTYESNNFGVGLPPARENKANWSVMSGLLADPRLRPAKNEIVSCLLYFQELLRIRKSSPLFRLCTAIQIQERVRFYNLGPNQVPGVMIMRIDDLETERLDHSFKLILVIFNARSHMMTVQENELKDLALQLHPVQQNSTDERLQQATYESASGQFRIPGRSTVVFVSY